MKIIQCCLLTSPAGPLTRRGAGASVGAAPATVPGGPGGPCRPVLPFFPSAPASPLLPYQFKRIFSNKILFSNKVHRNKSLTNGYNVAMHLTFD